MNTVIFLTSKLMDLNDDSNELAKQLREYWPLYGAKLLIVASYPDSHLINDDVAAKFAHDFSVAGFPVCKYQMLDTRNERMTIPLLREYDTIILMGGYVPEQNEYFQKIQLREKIQEFSGLIIGISAGSMNSADVVYVQPEYDEDVRDDFVKFRKGLNLTKVQILPHYQKIKYDVLKGKRLFEDITYSDSIGHEFYALVDGSFVRVKNGKNRLFGEAYQIKDGRIKLICNKGENIMLSTKEDTTYERNTMTKKA